MKKPRIPALTSSASPSPDAVHTASAAALSGRTLALARVAVGLVAVCAFGLFLISLPAYVRLSYSTCTSVPSACLSTQLSPADISTLMRFGMPASGVVTLGVAVTVGTALAWFAVAGILFWRRSDLLIALIVAMQLVTQGASGIVQAGVYPNWQLPADALSVLNSIMLFYVLALFPNGRFVPRWLVWVGLIWIPVQLTALVPGPLEQVGTSYLAFLGMMGCVIGAQIYRYRRVSTPTQRQQTKWVIVAVALATAIPAALSLPIVFDPALLETGSLYGWAVSQIAPLALVLNPVALAFALLRYRLYDIDVIIRRTLIYGTLTAILAALYFAVVASAQFIGERVTSQTPPPAWLIVVTTLAIAALFTPLRRRVQRTIDHRFYRSRYDAARTIEAFAATLRTELDLSELRDHLTGVVEETMRPAHVGLWLHQSRAAVSETSSVLTLANVPGGGER